MLNIGAHLSASKGFLHMAQEAVSIGANTFQFFTRNPRGFAARTLLKICSSWSEMDTIKSFPILRVSPSYILKMCIRDRNCSMQKFKEQLVLSIGTKLAVFVYHSQVLSGAGHRQKLGKFVEILETFGGKAMWQRNNGQAEDDLQFRFTAYLVSAVKRRRKDYLLQLYKCSSIESTVEVVYESEPSSEEVVLDKLPLMDVIENGALWEADVYKRQVLGSGYKFNSSPF